MSTNILPPYPTRLPQPSGLPHVGPGGPIDNPGLDEEGHTNKGWWAGGIVYIAGWIGFAIIDGNNPSRAAAVIAMLAIGAALLIVKVAVDWLDVSLARCRKRRGA